MTTRIPSDAEFVRSTPRFDETSVPQGLLKQHEVASGATGVLRVLGGELTFVWDDEAASPIRLREGDEHLIEPGRVHHLVVSGKVAFQVDFYRLNGATS